MKQPLIIAVHHTGENGGGLLDDVCRERFKKEISPLIDFNTLLLLEGAYHEMHHRRWHLFYLYWRFEAQNFVGAPIGFPVIGFRDKRFLKYGRVAPLLGFASRFIKHVEPLIGVPARIPKTFQKLLSKFAKGELKYSVLESQDEELTRALSLKILKLNALFDEPMIAAADEWGKLGRQVIIVCGSVHAVTIHRSTQWPVRFLMEESPKNLRALADTLIPLVLFPEELLRKTDSASD